MNNLANGFYNFSMWITRFTYVSLLWVLFTLLGLVIFGISPATAALFVVTRKWVQKDVEIPIFQTFWNEYKENFWKTNGLGLVLLAFGYLISIEYIVLSNMEGFMYNIATLFVIGQMILYGIVLIYFFPVYAHFNIEKRFDYYKWPFVIGVVHPILTVILIVLIAVIQFVTFYFLPIPINFVGMALSAYVASWGASLTFGKYESVSNHDKDEQVDEIEHSHQV